MQPCEFLLVCTKAFELTFCCFKEQYKKMSNLSKINFIQKEILGNFMMEHTELAKSIIPNTPQGKAKSNQLWEKLTAKLNASGPPVKDAKMWRKVYADQKQNVKKKISFNKSSKNKTGGGPYEEKVLSQMEEQILSAAGIEVSVEGLKNVQTFGSSKTSECRLKENWYKENIATTSPENSIPDVSPCGLSDYEEDKMVPAMSTFIEFEADTAEETSAPANNKEKKNTPQIAKVRGRESKSSLLAKNLVATELYQKEMLKRMDLLIEIKNKELKLKEKECALADKFFELKQKALHIKEMEHELNSQIKAMEFQIRRKELTKLNINF